MFPCRVTFLPPKHTAYNQTASELTAISSCHVSVSTYSNRKSGEKQCENELDFKARRIGQSLAGKGRIRPAGLSLGALKHARSVAWGLPTHWVFSCEWQYMSCWWQRAVQLYVVHRYRQPGQIDLTGSCSLFSVASWKRMSNKMAFCLFSG